MARFAAQVKDMGSGSPGTEGVPEGFAWRVVDDRGRVRESGQEGSRKDAEQMATAARRRLERGSGQAEAAAADVQDLQPPAEAGWRDVDEASQPDVVWLTPEAFDKLQAELGYLRVVVRGEVINRLSAAREEGDLWENSGYHAAREEQGKVEGRIRQLEDMLSRAAVGETPAGDAEVVEPGMKITTRFVDEDEVEVFLLGAREMAGAVTGIEVYSPKSPIGSAIMGKRKGDQVDFEAPNGKVLSLEILDVVPFRG